MAIIKCPKCGNPITDDAPICPKCMTRGDEIQRLLALQAPPKPPFRTWKLVSGILSIVLFFVVSLQSCVVGLGNTLLDSGEVSGSAGFIVSIMMLAGGIVSIATRNGGKGGNIALIVLFGIATFFGFVLAGSYSDLLVWSTWCLVNLIIAIIALVKCAKM